MNYYLGENAFCIATFQSMILFFNVAKGVNKISNGLFLTNDGI